MNSEHVSLSPLNTSTRSDSSRTRKSSVISIKPNRAVRVQVETEIESSTSNLWRLEIKITRPSLSQIEVVFVAPEIYISIVPHHYQVGRSLPNDILHPIDDSFGQIQWYDISVRMHYPQVLLSHGLCIMSSVNFCEPETNTLPADDQSPSLSRRICDEYLNASLQASVQLKLPNDSAMADNALIACVHDYETTKNKNVGRRRGRDHCLPFVSILDWREYGEHDHQTRHSSTAVEQRRVGITHHRQYRRRRRSNQKCQRTSECSS